MDVGKNATICTTIRTPRTNAQAKPESGRPWWEWKTRKGRRTRYGAANRWDPGIMNECPDWDDPNSCPESMQRSNYSGENKMLLSGS